MPHVLIDKAVVAASVIEPVLVKADNFYAAAKRCGSSILACEAQYFQAADARLKELDHCWQTDLASCLPEFVPSPEHARVEAATSRWLHIVFAGWCECLSPMLVPTLEVSDFERMQLASREHRAALVTASEGVAQAGLLFRPCGDLRDACKKATQISKTLSKWHSILATGSPTLPVAEYMEMIEKVGICFSPFPEAVADYPISRHAPADVLRSPFMSTTGPRRALWLPRFIMLGLLMWSHF